MPPPSRRRCCAWLRRCADASCSTSICTRRPIPTKANSAPRSPRATASRSSPDVIPDGFYLVDDSENPQPEFQRAIIEAVAKVTHIAPADDKNEIIGSPVVAPGVIEYPLRELGLCAGITGARYTTTTEVYPDSPRATPEQCNAAQVAAVLRGDRVRIAEDGLTFANPGRLRCPSP